MTKPPQRPAFYLRVSTLSQDFPSQLHAIREFCRRQGWPAPSTKTLFAEKVSGKRTKRRELDRLLAACRDGLFDAIITYRLDRLGNSMAHLVNVQAELRALKIRVIGVADGMDTANDSAANRAFENTLNTFASYGRELISERTRDGLAAAAKRGRVGGRPRKNEAKIKRVLALKAQGETHSEIHRRTGLSLGYVSMIVNGKRAAAPKPRQGAKLPIP